MEQAELLEEGGEEGTGSISGSGSGEMTASIVLCT